MDEEEKPTQQKLEERIATLEKQIGVYKKREQSYSHWLDEQAHKCKFDFVSVRDRWSEGQAYENAKLGFLALFSPNYDSNNERSFEEDSEYTSGAVAKYRIAERERLRREYPDIKPYRPSTIIIVDD